MRRIDSYFLWHAGAVADRPGNHGNRCKPYGDGCSIPFASPQCCFLLAGIAIGTTISPESVEAFARWPLAFAILALSILTMILVGQKLLTIIMRTDARTALLAATPGHLSFVVALGEEYHLAADMMAVVQTIRLLSLTLLVPIAFQLSGIETGVGIETPVDAEMSMLQTALAVICAIVVIPIFKFARLPAPTLMAGMAVGAVASLTGLTIGALSHWIAFPALAAIGTLIGSRFAGITIAQLRESAFAGLVGTALAVGVPLLAAYAAAKIVHMPMSHVFVAFAPGGLETMAIMGATIGANPGFVATAHAGRLLFLSLMIPVLINRK
jgi:membrane AbrB-like protein